MLEVSNIKVYDLEESIIAASYAMLTDNSDVDNRIKNLRFWFNLGDDFLIKFYHYIKSNPDFKYKLLENNMVSVKDDEGNSVRILDMQVPCIFGKDWKIIKENNTIYVDESFVFYSPLDNETYMYNLKQAVKDIDRIIKLSNTPQGSGHRNAIKGIRVSFDIKYPNYISPELQRYHFLDIISSSSKMHKLSKMDMNVCFNKYVSKEIIDIIKSYVQKYNENPTYENFMKLLSNCPQGIELFMRCSTNYEQLATIYKQRKTHKLKEDWGAFCNFIENLPLAKELITNV